VTTVDLGTAPVGTRVQDEFLVLERDDRTQANGDPFVILTLGNATGRLPTAPIWAEQLSWIEGIEPGVVAQVVGQVAVYSRTNRRQVQLTAPMRRVSSELVQWDAFLPRISVDVVRLWDRIDRMRSEMESTTLRAVVDLFFADDAFRVEFERAPATVDGHHAARGGLLLHVWEVAAIGRQIARTVQAHVDLVVAGALLHDVGAVEASAASPFGFRQTERGRLLGPGLLASAALDERLRSSSTVMLSDAQHLELEHLLLSAHAGTPGSVATMTVESDIVRQSHEASARANVLAVALADDRLFDGTDPVSSRLVARVGGRVWRRAHEW
jgi:3'-5' exoribonuclease